MIQSASKSQLPAFFAYWSVAMDETLPNWVKTRYAPNPKWKEKPFGEHDLNFFLKGIEELSDLFTDSKMIPSYFQNPKYRSSYLLYFLPLQSAKFLILFEQYNHVLLHALHKAQQKNVFAILDLGAGPGTASLSFLLWLESFLSNPLHASLIPQAIELHWWDQNLSIMKDGADFCKILLQKLPILSQRVVIRLHSKPITQITLPAALDLTLMGHFLNEIDRETFLTVSTHHPSHRNPLPISTLLVWLENRIQGAGLLILEPANQQNAQMLSQLRDFLIQTRSQKLWGPCLHSGPCPLLDGRDWCHFSEPVNLPGRWFNAISNQLGSKKTWLKYSYLWLAADGSPIPIFSSSVKRVISDPIPDLKSKGRKKVVLVCEPERPVKKAVPEGTPLKRGWLANFD